MKSTVPAPAAELLDFISGPEAQGNYLAYYGHATSTAPLPKTLEDVLLWQANYVKGGSRSSAIGRYEFMPKTLQDLMKTYGIPGSEAFTNDLQDELGFYLLVRRGYNTWISGGLADATFADNLSKEWASLPYHTGSSYYGGDGLNRSLVSRESVLDALAKAKGATAPTTKEAPMTNASTSAAATVAAAPKTTATNPLDGVIQFAENIATQIESAIAVVASPTNNVGTSVSTGTATSTLFPSIGQAEAALSALLKMISDARAGNWSNEPADVVDFVEKLLATLVDFGVSIPGLSILNTILPKLEPVVAAL